MMSQVARVGVENSINWVGVPFLDGRFARIVCCVNVRCYRKRCNGFVFCVVSNFIAMRLTILRYSAILTFQTFLFLMDFGINTFSVLVRKHNAITLIMFMWVLECLVGERLFFFGDFRIQDVCLILALAALLLTFFSTYVFQVLYFAFLMLVITL